MPVGPGHFSDALPPGLNRCSPWLRWHLPGTHRCAVRLPQSPAQNGAPHPSACVGVGCRVAPIPRTGSVQQDLVF